MAERSNSSNANRRKPKQSSRGNHRREENQERLINQRTAITKYGVTKKIIDRYFPKPIVKYYGGYRYVRLWKEEEVEEALKQPEVQQVIRELAESRKREQDLLEARRLLGEYTPENLIEKAKGLRRAFVLHVGATNSGKTYDAVQALKTAGNGTYLGPLRLLALEMFEKINKAGIPCSLLTGEESYTVDGAKIVSSTIELCVFQRHFKVAVIDEAQLIADGERGSSWLKAICSVDAEEVHICLAPEGLEYIENLVSQFGDPYAVVRHERLVPLEYKGRIHGFKDIRPNDAVICFSRKNVLSTAAHLERNGFKASVIYGALPPLARRNEVEKYLSGETNVIVATDAIGLGISLPIQRIVFAETQKFDGHEQRFLNSGEVRQIAGRAGRYGMFDLGEVVTMTADNVVEDGMRFPSGKIRTPCIEFPREALSTEYDIDLLLRAWQSLPGNKSFKREDMSSALSLFSMLRENGKGKDRELIFDLITCPVDADNRELSLYWLSCARAILRGRHIPNPHFDTDTLLGCELQYKAYDVNHQLKMRIGIQDDNFEQREAVCQKIKELMAEKKDEFIRKCAQCGAELPIGYTFNLCENCFRSGASVRYRYR